MQMNCFVLVAYYSYTADEVFNAANDVYRFLDSIFFIFWYVLSVVINDYKE